MDKEKERDSANLQKKIDLTQVENEFTKEIENLKVIFIYYS